MAELRDNVNDMGYLCAEFMKRCVSAEKNINSSVTLGRYMSPGKNITIVGSQACHGGLQSISGGSIYIFSRIQSMTKNGTISDKERLPYLKYLLNDSFLSDSFIIKDPEEVLNLGCCVVDSKNFPANYTLLSLFAFRVMWEHPVIVRTFLALKDSGVHPDLAFILANCVMRNRDKSMLAVKPSNITHYAFDSWHLTLSHVKNILERKMIQHNKYSLFDGRGYSAVNNLYLSPVCRLADQDNKFDNYFRKNYSRSKEKIASLVATNPFIEVWNHQLDNSSYREIPEPFESAIKNLVDISKMILEDIEEYERNSKSKGVRVGG